MSSPSPFEIGRQVGNNFANVRKTARDESSIEQILSQAMGSGDPAVLQNSIGQILSQVSPERQGAAIQYLQNAHSNILKKQEQENQFKREKDAGLVPGINPTAQTAIYHENSKNNRLSQYGLGNQLNNQSDNQQNLDNKPNPETQPIQNISGSPFRKLTDDQLVNSQAHPDIEIRQGAAAEQKRREAERKIDQKDITRLRNEELQFHKESEKYDDELLKQTKIAKKQVDTIKDIDKSLSSGNVSPSSLANIFKGFGKIGDKISEALINKDEATILASIPQLLEGWKEVFGVRLSDADLKLLQDKLPSIGKSAEANQAIVKVLRKYADMTLLRSSIAKEIKQNNKGLRPLGYADKIEERFDEMVMPVKIINPKNGRTIEIPAYKVSDAIKAGGKLANE